MPVGYLFTVAVVAWCTVAALVPVRRPRGLARVAFVSGLAINEVSCLALYFLLASTALAAFDGDLASSPAIVVLALAALTVAGLVAIMARQLQAPGVVNDAVEDGLGREGPGGDTHGTSSARRRRGHPIGALLFPSRARRAGVERIANIAYGTAGRENELDVYRSRTGISGGPVLVHLHGGSFRSGRKNHEGLPLIYSLAGQGWLCISANYRLQPGASPEDQLVDVKRIIAWVRRSGGQYGTDPAALFLAGASAGATLAALAALTANDAAYQPGFTGVDTSVTAAVCLYGYYGPSSLGGSGEAEPETPIGRVHPAAPAFFIAHGDNDSVLDVRGARDFAGALRRVSRNAVVYAELPGAQHQFDLFRSVRANSMVTGVQAFADFLRAGT